jgi:D-3-phosphoglycerate dehydrogenase
MYQVLITDSVHPNMIALFESKNCIINYQPNINQEAVEAMIENYDVLVINSKIQVHQAFIDKAKKLKVVGRLGSGKEIIDLNYAEQQGIIFHNSPEGNRDAVAEHALGMILSLLNHIPKSYNEVLHFNWNRESNRGHELANKTIALIGYGNTGSETAKRLVSFGCKILAYDKFVKNFGTNSIVESTMQEVFEHADIVSLHIPLTDLTNHLVNESFIHSFKKKFYLINTSRGKVVDENAVVNALSTGKIIGFASDVLENEKLDSYTEDERKKLKDLLKYNTIITPHIAGWTYESKEKLARILAEKILMSLKIQ